MSQVFLYDYRLIQLTNRAVSGRLTAASEDGQAILTVSSSTIYIYHYRNSSFQFKSINLSFQPKTPAFYEEQSGINKSALIRIKGQHIIIYVLQQNNLKNVAKITIRIPIPTHSASIENFQASLEVKDMQYHPIQNSLILFNEAGFHFLQPNYTYPLSQNYDQTLLDSKIYIQSGNETVDFYSFYMFNDTFKVAKVQQHQYLTNYGGWEIAQLSKQEQNRTFYQIQRFGYRSGIFGLLARTQLNNDTSSENYFIDEDFQNNVYSGNKYFFSFTMNPQMMLLKKVTIDGSNRTTNQLCHIPITITDSLTIDDNDNICVDYQLRTDELAYEEGYARIQYLPQSYTMTLDPENQYFEMEQITQFSLKYSQHLIAIRNQQLQVYKFSKTIDEEAIVYLSLIGFILLIHLIIFLCCICRPLFCTCCCQVEKVIKERRKKKEYIDL